MQKFVDLDHTVGQELIYNQNDPGPLQQNDDFLSSGTKTVASKNWDRIEDTSSSNIVKRQDIEDFNEPPFIQSRKINENSLLLYKVHFLIRDSFFF